MVIVTNLDALCSLSTHGTFGFSGGFGLLRFSYNRFGFFDSRSGIYQRKKTLKGWRTSRARFYRPTNPQTSLQQAWRAIFSAGWTAWGGLTPNERALYSKEAIQYGLSGPNLFMRRWLHQHRS